MVLLEHCTSQLQWRRCISLVVMALVLAFSGREAQAQWTTVNANTPAAIRSITKSNNRLIGGRVGGNPNAIEVWASTTNGASWARVGTVAGPTTTVIFGDPCFLSDGGGTVFCAFRENQGTTWRIVVCRSTDGGNSWLFDSIVADNNRSLFLGAPYLWFSRDGTIQCYYDSEQVAADAGRPGAQWIFMNARPKNAARGTAWNSYTGIASRPANPAVFARDGLASVVNLDGSTMMLVCEGVDPNNTARNCLFAVKSYNNGRTWDFNSRQRIWAPIKNGVQFNAYDPHAVRYGNGPVGVVFCTDDDFAAPSANNAPPHLRNAHVKFIRTLTTFEQWGDLQTVEAGQNSMYSPGLFEISFNTLLSTIDFYGGRQVIKRR